MFGMIDVCPKSSSIPPPAHACDIAVKVTSFDSFMLMFLDLVSPNLFVVLGYIRYDDRRWSEKVFCTTPPPPPAHPPPTHTICLVKNKTLIN